MTVTAVAQGGMRDRTAEAPDIETSSEDYARRFAGPVGAWFLQVQREAVLRLLARWPTARVLEVGGGHGQLAEAVSRAGHQVTVHGSDEVCRERIQGLMASGRCTFMKSDLLTLPAAARSFDVVIAVRLLTHLPEWPRFIRELTRVARRAVIVDYAPRRSFNALYPMLFGAKRRVEGDTRTFLTHGEDEIAEAFGACGFSRADAVREFFWPMVGHRVLRRPGLSKAMEWGPGAIGLTRLLGSPVIALFTRNGRS